VDQDLQRQTSVRNTTGFRLSDVLDEDDNELVDPDVLAHKDLLDSLEELVDALFSQKKFLSYIASLDEIVSSVLPSRKGRNEVPNRDNLRMLQSVVKLMKHTVDSHARHPCTELRYVTLMEVLLSYQTDPWEPSTDINLQWKRLGCHVDPGTEPEDFRRQAYQVLVSLPYVPPSAGLYSACSYEESEATAAWDTLPLCIRSRLEQIPEPLLRSEQVHHILHKIRDRDSFTVAISSSSMESFEGDSSTLETAGEGIGKTTLATLLAAHPSISEDHTIFWVDLQEERWATSAKGIPEMVECGLLPPLSHATYMR
jgi:hypothetical protein